MGVPGLWKLLEAARRKADLEQFRGKKMAVDMNMWLHQALKSRGTEATGNPNFYLAILFRRICKLLFFGIKPVFVFDGAVPDLKKATIAARRTSRQNMQAKSDRARGRLLNRLLHRIAKAETGGKSTKDLSAELLQRLKSSEDARRAEIDQDMFGRSSSEYSEPTSGNISALEEGQELAASLARDFLDGLPSLEDVDLESEAFAALPPPAQLHVLLMLQGYLTSGKLARHKTIEGEDDPSTGAAFSTLQLNRLILRRKLTTKQAQIHQLFNEKAVREVVSSLDDRTADLIRTNFSADLDNSVQVKASRIVSQDQGHTILLKKETSLKTPTVSPLERLRRVPCAEPSSDTEVASDAIPTEPAPDVISTREGSPAEEAVRVKLTLPAVDDVSVNPEQPPKSPSPLASDAVRLVVSSPPSGHTSPVESSHHLSPVEALEEHSPTPAALAEVTPHAAKIPNSSPVTFHAVDADSSTEPLYHKSQDSPIPVEDMSPVNPTENDHKTSEPETSSSEDDFIDVEEVVTSPSVPTVSLDSTQEGLSSRVLPDAEVDADDESLHEVVAAVQDEVSMEPPKPTEAPGTSYWETLVGSEEEDDFEFDDEFLRAQADRMERLAQQTSTDVIAEAQRLLFLFGLPFIVSPEEAEAQCCRLQQLGLVDVVASDDSDVWLFGARLVLRHLFTAPKDSFTAAYSAEDIHRRLGLDRAQFLRIALLCGSDYTTGVPKIGPVKAMEILSEFAGKPNELPSNCPEDLAVKRTVSSVIEPLEKFRTTVMNSREMPSPSKSSPSKCRWRSISLPNDFPNATVVEAYLSPNVDVSASEFIWNNPQVSELVKFAVERLGWSPTNSEATLSSVLEKFNSPVKKTTLITDFFPLSPKKPVGLPLAKRAKSIGESQKVNYAAEFVDILNKDDGTWLKTPSVALAETSTPECSLPTECSRKIRSRRRRSSSPVHGVGGKGGLRKRRRKQL